MGHVAHSLLGRAWSWSNKLSMKALEEALKQNATLMNLDMSRTKIGDEGVCALGLDTELCLSRSPFIPYHST